MNFSRGGAIPPESCQSRNNVSCPSAIPPTLLRVRPEQECQERTIAPQRKEVDGLVSVSQGQRLSCADSGASRFPRTFSLRGLGVGVLW